MNKQNCVSSFVGKRVGTFLIIFLSGCLMGISAQKRVVQVLKNGDVVFQSIVSDIDSVIFYNPEDSIVVPTADVLVISKAGGLSSDQASLDKVQNLTFSEETFLLAPSEGNALSYSYDEIKSLSFTEAGLSVIYVSSNNSEINAYVTPQGVINVICEDNVLSLRLLSMDGKVLSENTSNTLPVAHLSVGCYLLQIETANGTFVKKVINRINNR